ncbi:MAG: AAA family ATPase [Myxococcota bacterium]
MKPEDLRRVVVVGTSCAGKTTLARELASILGCPHVELDALFWEADWTQAADDVFRERTRIAIAGDRWVLDGNYSRVTDLVWPRATAVAWLNLGFATVFSRAVRRTWRRIRTSEELWAGNRERLTVLDPDWIPWWVIRTFHRRRRTYADLLRREGSRHYRVFELRGAAEVRNFLDRARGLG